MKPKANLSKVDVEFIRLFFPSPEEEEVAVRYAQFISRFAGERVSLLRPDTKWSEIIEWVGPSILHAVFFANALKKEFGVQPEEIFADSESVTFRDFVEYIANLEKNRD